MPNHLCMIIRIGIMSRVLVIVLMGIGLFLQQQYVMATGLEDALNAARDTISSVQNPTSKL